MWTIRFEAHFGEEIRPIEIYNPHGAGGSLHIRQQYHGPSGFGWYNVGHLIYRPGEWEIYNGGIDMLWVDMQILGDIATSGAPKSVNDL